MSLLEIVDLSYAFGFGQRAGPIIDVKRLCQLTLNAGFFTDDRQIARSHGMTDAPLHHSQGHAPPIGAIEVNVTGTSGLADSEPRAQ